MTAPSILTILVCHSMGGIVAADVLLKIFDEPTVSRDGTKVMFPYIQGILAFDTPYLGLAPSMLAHTVDAKVKTANEMLNQVSSVAAGLFAGSTMLAGTTMLADSTKTTDGKQAMASSASPQEPKAAEENVRQEKRGGSKGGSHSRNSSRSTKTGGSKHSRKVRDESKATEDNVHQKKRSGSRSERHSRSSSRSTNTSGSKHSGKVRDESKPRKSSLPPSTTTTATTTSTTITDTTTTATAATSAWKGWGKVAMLASAVGAFAAAGAVGYYKREDIAAGFGWVSSHLEFVSELTKHEVLKTRLSRSKSIRGIGFANLYTSLGNREKSSTVQGGNMAPPPGTDPALASFLAAERTFCREPGKGDEKQGWYKMVNTKAKDEVEAHTGMFNPQTNPGFYNMSDHARNIVLQWVEART